VRAQSTYRRSRRKSRRRHRVRTAGRLGSNWRRKCATRSSTASVTTCTATFSTCVTTAAACSMRPSTSRACSFAGHDRLDDSTGPARDVRSATGDAIGTRPWSSGNRLYRQRLGDHGRRGPGLRGRNNPRETTFGKGVVQSSYTSPTRRAQDHDRPLYVTPRAATSAQGNRARHHRHPARRSPDSRHPRRQAARGCQKDHRAKGRLMNASFPWPCRTARIGFNPGPATAGAAISQQQVQELIETYAHLTATSIRRSTSRPRSTRAHLDDRLPQEEARRQRDTAGDFAPTMTMRPTPRFSRAKCRRPSRNTARGSNRPTRCRVRRRSPTRRSLVCSLGETATPSFSRLRNTQH